MLFDVTKTILPHDEDDDMMDHAGCCGGVIKMKLEFSCESEKF